MADRSSLYGAGFSYPLRVNAATGSVVGASAADSVRAALHRLFDTAPGEERFNPGFGCGLKGLLFENDTLVFRALVDRVIRQAVARCEPRIAQVVYVTVTPDAVEPTRLLVQVGFQLLQSPTVFNMVYPLTQPA